MAAIPSSVVTPIVGRIHYNSTERVWHLSMSRMQDSPLGHRYQQFKDDFDSILALIQFLFQIWAIVGTDTAVLGRNSPEENKAAFVTWLSTQLDLTSVMPDPPDSPAPAEPPTAEDWGEYDGEEDDWGATVES